MKEKLKRILKRKAEIRAKLDAQIQGTIELTEEEIKALQGELTDLNAEEEAVLDEEEKEEERNKAAALEKTMKTRSIAKPEEENEPEKRNLTVEEKKKRGKELKEKRAITVGNSQIAVPKYTAKGVKDTFNEVSTLIDLVTITPLEGGETYERGYVISTDGSL